MCDHHHLRPPVSVGEIEHVNFLSENIGSLYLKEDYSDIILITENEKIYGHKVVLAARSEYFRALLFGGLRESRPGVGEIELKQTNATAFKHLLKYIYTGRMNLVDLSEETLLDVLELSHQYLLLELESSISDYLKAILNARNVCLIYDMASMYSLKSLCHTCSEFMDRNATDIIKTEAFLSLSPTALKEIIARDSFCAAEIDIFQAIKKWAAENGSTGDELADVISAIRLPLMSLEELLNEVRPSNLMSADVILDAIKVKSESSSVQLDYRGFLVPDENVATARSGAAVIRGEMKASLLDGDNINYDLDRGFTRHPIDDNNGQGIVIKLVNPYIINTIKMLLWDRDMRSYSYYIEVSMDEKDWSRVIDYSKYMCRSWQYLRFPDKVVRYIRIVGTHNTVNRVFHLVSVECYYSRKPFNVDHGVLVPSENVATIPASACVVEGVSRSRNALINGDTKNYDWDSGYTCHQLGSGSIVVQLAQPYMIGSMRLLLWDCDGRSYSYYVDVSTDQQKWQLVADKTKETCRSWQTIVFEPRPVTFVRIVGTHNTANEVFHCVHFECPAEITALAEYEAQKALSAATGQPRSSPRQADLEDQDSDEEGGKGAVGGGAAAVNAPPNGDPLQGIPRSIQQPAGGIHPQQPGSSGGHFVATNQFQPAPAAGAVAGPSGVPVLAAAAAVAALDRGDGLVLEGPVQAEVMQQGVVEEEEEDSDRSASPALTS